MSRAREPILRRTRLRHLAWLLVPYAAGLWWVHALIRQPLNLEYFKSYVSLRCAAEQLERRGHPVARDAALELEKHLRRCEDVDVAVDGIWGGLRGEASVRLKVVYDRGTDTRFSYYSVDVDPVLGIASIRYGLSPNLYYLNF